MPRAIGKKVFVVLDPEEKADYPQTASGIVTEITPVKKIPTMGTITSFGKDVAERGELKVGERVFLGQHYPEPSNIEGEMIVITNQEGILAVL